MLSAIISCSSYLPSSSLRTLGIGILLEELLSYFGAYSDLGLPIYFAVLFVWSIALILLIRQNRLHEKRHAEGHPPSRVQDVTLLVLSIIHLLVLLALALWLFEWDFQGYFGGRLEILAARCCWSIGQSFSFLSILVLSHSENN